MKRKLEEERNKDENELATRLGINYFLTKTACEILGKVSDFFSTLGDFINTCVITFLQVLAKNVWD